MTDQTAEALTHFGNMAMQQRNDTLARGLYEEGLAIWRALDYQPGIAHLLEKLERLACSQNGTSLPAGNSVRRPVRKDDRETLRRMRRTGYRSVVVALFLAAVAGPVVGRAGSSDMLSAGATQVNR